MVEESCGGPH